MLVHNRPFIPGKLQHMTGVAHRKRERSGLRLGQSTKENGHEKRGHLVVGNLPVRERFDDLPNLASGQGLPLALRFDERKKVQASTHKLLCRNRRVVTAEAK